MADRINFTKAALEKLTPAAGTDRVWTYDARTPSLAFLVTEKGARSFYIYRRVNGRPQRIRLGGFPDLTIEQARTEAAKVNGTIATGGDPMAEKRKARTSMTMAELLANYIETHARHHKKTWQDDQAQFERYFGKAPADRTDDDKPAPFPAWRTRRLNSISEADVKALHAKVGANHGPYAANRLLALLSAMFNNAKLENPAKGVKKFREHERERFLHPDELPKFFAALAKYPDPTIRDFLLTAILTGARRSNVQAMRWDEVHLDRATWTIPDTKNGDALTVHLPPPALRILGTRWQNREASPYVFPSYGKTGHLAEPKTAWKKILTAAGIEDLRIHDLRRTLGSWQAAGGASLPIIGKSLGHKHERTTKIYARLSLDPVKQSVNAATGAMEGFMPAGLLPSGSPSKG